ncbi:MAG: hypothetical protein FGM45_06165 [Actinobacteria bacterium]|nr:hypothetical protein [Actinomycetota bacterium]
MSFGQVHPHLLQEWHPHRNTGVSPESLSFGSNIKVWWLCSKGHEWLSSPKARSRGGGCPVCSNKKLLVGYNDLATLRPELAVEWHPHRNSPLAPQDVLPGSDRKVWWLCSKGHEWQTSLNNRFTGEGTGCPTCSGRRVLTGFNDLATRHPEVAAEWHPTRNGDLTASQVGSGSSKKVWWLCPVAEDHEWEATVAMRTGSKKATGCAVCSGRRVVTSTSLATRFPEVAGEWHPHKNLKKPSEVTPFVTRKAWWICREGHEWEASIASRTVGQYGCPFCSGSRAIRGSNDLATTHPEVASEWHLEKNHGKNAEDFKAGSNTAVWWNCRLGHAYRSVIANRTLQGSGCPYCAGQKPIEGVNDLQTTHPDLALQWHPVKNLPLTAGQVMAGTDKKIWWLCEEGHEWQAPPYNRKQGVGCPVCAIPGFNPGKPGWLYFLFHEQWAMFQIGISNVPEERLRRHRQKGWEVRELRGPMDGYLTADLERSCLASLLSRGAELGRRSSHFKFDGHTESWSAASLEVTGLKEILDWVYLDEGSSKP